MGKAHHIHMRREPNSTTTVCTIHTNVKSSISTTYSTVPYSIYTNRIVAPLRPRADLLTADEDVVAVGVARISRVEHSVERPVYMFSTYRIQIYVISVNMSMQVYIICLVYSHVYN